MPSAHSWAAPVRADGTVQQGWRYAPKRPKARGLAQHGGPPGWLEESNQAGVILYVIARAVPPAFSILHRLPWQKLLRCKLMEFPAADKQ